MSKWDLFQVCKAGSIFEKSINIIHHIKILNIYISNIISIHGKKPFDKIQHPFIVKKLRKIGIEGSSSSL